MGYRSQVAVKTTAEGFAVIQQRESEQKEPDLRLLKCASEIRCTSKGNYRIDWNWIKWYDSYPEIQYFMASLDKLEELEIPYSFVRIGEDSDDIEHKVNWTDDIPDAIQSLEPVVDINDDEAGDYTPIPAESDPSEIHIINIMFDLFDKYEECDDIRDALRSLNSEGEVSEEEYAFAMLNWDDLLNKYEKTKI